MRLANGHGRGILTPTSRRKAWYCRRYALPCTDSSSYLVLRSTLREFFPLKKVLRKSELMAVREEAFAHVAEVGSGRSQGRFGPPSVWISWSYESKLPILAHPSLGGSRGEFRIDCDQMEGSLLFQIWLDEPKA